MPRPFSPSSRLDRVSTLCVRRQELKEELEEVEKEIFRLLNSTKRVAKKTAVKKATKAPVQTKPASEPNGVKPPVSRNKVKCLNILRASGKGMWLKDIYKKLGISNSGTFTILRQLVNDGYAFQPEFGMYQIKTDSKSEPSAPAN